MLPRCSHLVKEADISDDDSNVCVMYMYNDRCLQILWRPRRGVEKRVK